MQRLLCFLYMLLLVVPVVGQEKSSAHSPAAAENAVAGLETRSWGIPKAFFASGLDKSQDEVDVKGALIEMGVKFPPGAKATYNCSNLTLTVTNTKRELRLIHALRIQYLNERTAKSQSVGELMAEVTPIYGNLNLESSYYLFVSATPFISLMQESENDPKSSRKYMKIFSNNLKKLQHEKDLCVLMVMPDDVSKKDMADLRKTYRTKVPMVRLSSLPSSLQGETGNGHIHVLLKNSQKSSRLESAQVLCEEGDIYAKYKKARKEM